MPNYRRLKIAGGIYAFTVVTYQRLPIFAEKEAREILRDAWDDVGKRFPFTTDAICVLPDHVHCMWSLPEGDANYSVRWKEIKRVFSKVYQRQVRLMDSDNESRMVRKEAGIWQRRFWEHAIRDEVDLYHHFDYIHFNPVKHGYVKNVRDWPWSSFHRFVQLGLYDKDWGSDVSIPKGFYGGE